MNNIKKAEPIVWKKDKPPYVVKVRQTGIWQDVFASHDPAACVRYIQFKISYTGLARDKTARVELHDNTSCLCTAWDSTWGLDKTNTA